MKKCGSSEVQKYRSPVKWLANLKIPASVMTELPDFRTSELLENKSLDI